MKTFEFIASANESMKLVANNLRSANKEYTSLSRVLKDIQRADLMKSGYKSVFEGLGLPTDGKVTPKMLLDATCPEQWGRSFNKKGEPVGDEWLGIWGWAQKKDETGAKIYEEDGVTPVMVAVLRKVTAWSPTKLFKVYAQAQALKAAK